MKLDLKAKYEYRERTRRHIILFMISPFISLVDAIKGRDTKIIMNVFWAFSGYHGFTQVILEGADSERYADTLLRAHNQIPSWDNFIGTFFTEENVDIVFPLVNYILALFTDNSRILFLVLGIIFGYFYSRNIGYLLNTLQGKLNKTSIFLVILFALVIPFWQINGFRMWTAAHIFFYAGVRIIDGKIGVKNILLLLLVPLTHFSFLLPLAVIGLYKLLGNRILLFYILFVVTFFVSELNIDTFREVTTVYTPDFYGDRIDSYTSEQVFEELEDKQEELRFYIKYQNLILRIGAFILLIFLFVKRQAFKEESKKGYNYLGFSLLFLSIANIMNLVPSGGRFILVGNLFLVTTFIYLYTTSLRYKIPWFYRKISFSTFLFYSLVSFWQGFQFMSLMVILGNPIFALFANLDFSLMDTVKLKFL